MTTPEEITKALEKIGWSVDNDPANRFLRNHLNERTNLFLRTDAIQLEFGNKGMWGERGNGCLYFGYKDITIRESEGCVALAVTSEIFLQFYNHA